MLDKILKNPDFTIEYSQLNNPDKDDKTFLNDLFDLGNDYEKRTPFFAKNNKDNRGYCYIEIRNVPISNKDDKKDNLHVKLKFEEKSFRIDFFDKKGKCGFQISYIKFNNQLISTSEVEKNIFSGNTLMKTRYLVLSMLGIPTDSVQDLSDCNCPIDNLSIPLHIFRILTHDQASSWYIGTHGYTPRHCTLEDYRKSAKFFRNLTLKKLEILSEENQIKYGIDFKKFYNAIYECFEKAKENNLFNEEGLTEITFSAFAKLTYASQDEKIDEIFHAFIDKVNYHAFMSRYLLSNSKQIEEMIKDTKNTVYENFLNLSLGNKAIKEIKPLKFKE
jgi:hypothetical protein